MEDTEETLDEKSKEAQKVGEEFAVRSNEGDEMEEPRDEKPNDAQKTKDRAFYVPVDEEFAAKNGKSS